MDYDYTLKIILVGDHSTGKSTFFRKICNLDLEYIPSTVGVDFFTKYIIKDNNKIKINLWDTAGQERFRAIIVNYFRNISGILLFFDLNKEETFHSIEKWLKNLEDNNLCDHNHPIILIGNKNDLIKTIDDNLIKKTINKYKLIYKEISVKNHEVEYIFNLLIDLLYNNLIKKNIICKGIIYNKINENNDILILKDNSSNTEKKKCCFIN